MINKSRIRVARGSWFLLFADKQVHGAAAEKNSKLERYEVNLAIIESKFGQGTALFGLIKLEISLKSNTNSLIWTSYGNVLV